MKMMDNIGRRSVLACPDCHGVMWEIDEGEVIRYRCHVGHAYTGEMMRLALDENLTRALGSALRAFDERIAITVKLRDKALLMGQKKSADWWSKRIADVEREAKIIRDSIERMAEIAASQVVLAEDDD
jgi:two-component system chemotaxis response regulator CheB